jgi:hypothetical protein
MLKTTMSLSLALALGTTTAYGQNKQDDNAQKPPPYSDPRSSDAGRPSGPLNPPANPAPLTGSSLTPPSGNYLGKAPDGTANSFQTSPGYLPRGDEHRPQKPPKNTTALPNSSVVVTMPPASTGRQGLPPQTWALLTPRQQDLHRQVETLAMSSALGEGFNWNNDGRYGEVRVIADRINNNRPCRDFVHTVIIDGQRINGTTTICR